MAEGCAPDATPLLEPPCTPDPVAPADLVLHDVLLGLPDGGSAALRSQPVSLAVAGGIITVIGSRVEVERLVREQTRVIEAGGRTLLPGFVDSHLHLTMAMQRKGSLDMEGIATLEEFRDRLRGYLLEHPDIPFIRIFGVPYGDPPVMPSDGCRQVLDAIVADRPVLVFAHDLHTCWANTKSLELAGLFCAMPPFPPLIAMFGLEDNLAVGDDGFPSGEFREPEVCALLTGPLEAHFPRPIEEQLMHLEEVCHTLASHGITTVHSMGLAQPAEDISFLLLLLELEQKGRLPIRVCTSISALADSHALHDVALGCHARNALLAGRRRQMDAAALHDLLVELLVRSGGMRLEALKRMVAAPGPLEGGHPLLPAALEAVISAHGHNHQQHVQPHLERPNPHGEPGLSKRLGWSGRIRCDTIKIFMDGVVEKGTAYRLDQKPAGGIPEWPAGRLDELVAFADSRGMQVAAHCIGDGSVRSMLDAVGRARVSHRELDAKRGHRIMHRIEHIEMCRDEDIPRFAKESVIASMQPLHERPPMTLWHELVPREQWGSAFAWRDFLASGASLVFGSDWPIVSCDVMRGMAHASSRMPWCEGVRSQRVDPQQALDAYSATPAVCEYSAAIKGVLKPGMAADFVLLASGRPVLTVCCGAIVYNCMQEA